MNKKYVWTIMILAAMSLTACSVKPEEGGAAADRTAESSIEQRTTEEEIRSDAAQNDMPGDKADADNETANSGTEEIAQGDPVIGIVDRYENDIIVIRDADDEDIILYFSTQNAQVIEGDTPIAAGDLVEITYEGVQGDEEHPGVAVKVVAESMMYNRGE